MRIGSRTAAVLAGSVVLAAVASGCAEPRFPEAARITLDKQVALSDEAVRIRVTDLRPWTEVSVSARTKSPQGLWHSTAVFRADGHGVVDLRDRPVGGSYAKPDGMGLFWSLKTGRGGPAYFWPGEPEQRRSYAVRLTVSRDGERLARRTVTRVRMSDGVRHRALTVAADGVNGTLYLPPERSGTAAPVLVFGGSEGGNSTTGMAALLASRGHPALSLCYFGCPGRPAELGGIETEYFAAAAELVARQEASAARKLVVIGCSRGSEPAQLLGRHHPELVEDVVVYASSNLVSPALSTDAAAAWTRAGRPVPEGPIPLSAVRGAVLGIVGGDDRLWSSEFRSEGIADDGRLLVYPHAGHFVSGPPYLPAAVTQVTDPDTGGTTHYGGTRAANSAAMANSWPKVLKLLEE